MSAAYDAIDAVRWSRLKAMRVSPLQYKHELDAARTDAPFFRIGLALHCFVLEPDTFNDRFVCFNGTRRGKIWDQFQEDHATRTILNAAEWGRALGAATAVLGHPVAAQYLASGLKEATLTWTDEVTGLPLKARVDHCGAHLVDLKSTANLDLRMFAASAARLGYREQLAFYLDGLLANGVAVSPEPLIIAVESNPPHDVVVFTLTEDDMRVGRDEYRRLLAMLKHCRETNTWPGRAPDPVQLVMPAWSVPFEDGLELDIGGEQVAM